MAIERKPQGSEQAKNIPKPAPARKDVRKKAAQATRLGQNLPPLVRRDPKSFIKETTKGTYKVDFKGDNKSERTTGLHDLFGKKTPYLLVTYGDKHKKAGAEVYAERKRGHYYLPGTNKRVLIFTGDIIDIPKSNKDLAAYKGEIQEDRRENIKKEKLARAKRRKLEQEKAFIAQLPTSLMEAALVVREKEFNIRRPGAKEYLQKCLNLHKKLKRKNTYEDWLETTTEVHRNEMAIAAKGAKLKESGERYTKLASYIYGLKLQDQYMPTAIEQQDLMDVIIKKDPEFDISKPSNKALVKRCITIFKTKNWPFNYSKESMWEKSLERARAIKDDKKSTPAETLLTSGSARIDSKNKPT